MGRAILVEVEASDMLHSEPPPVQLFIITGFSLLLKRKKEMKNICLPTVCPRLCSTNDFGTGTVTSNPPLRSKNGIVFKERCRKRGQPTWCYGGGLSYAIKGMGTDNWTRFEKGSGPYH